MAIDYKYLATLPQDEVIKYLEELWGTGNADWAGALKPVYETSTVNETGPRLLGYMSPGAEAVYGEGVSAGDYLVNGMVVRPNTGNEATPAGGYYGPDIIRGQGTQPFDPTYEGDAYGHYEQQFSPTGEYLGTVFKKDERHVGWFSENIDWLGPLIVGGAMGLGAVAGAGAAGAGAGAAGAGAISPGVMAGLEAGLPGAGVGTAGTAAGAAAAEAGLAGLGELGINTALTGTELLANNAYAAALANGASAEVAANAAQIATNLAGSGLTDAAIIDSAVAAAGDTMATGAVGAAGNVIGGGGALTVTGGPTGGFGGASLADRVVSKAIQYGDKLATKAVDKLTDPVNLLAAGATAADLLTSKPPNTTSGAGAAVPVDMRTSPAWDLERARAAAADAGMPLNTYVARNWDKFATGQFNQPPAAAATPGLARGGAPLSRVARLARGAGSGRADTIDAKLSDGEYVMDAETVAMLGDGSTQEGARKLEEMRRALRKHKGRVLARGGFSPNAKSPLSYIKGMK